MPARATPPPPAPPPTKLAFRTLPPRCHPERIRGPQRAGFACWDGGAKDLSEEMRLIPPRQIHLIPQRLAPEAGLQILHQQLPFSLPHPVAYAARVRREEHIF